eukprot:scaffold4736_cov105-Cylindrotheca_fusiformis.AAC.4
MQQKAQKDAERKKKKEAAESLATFRGVDKQQELLLEARKAKQQDREKTKGAAENLHTFKGASGNQELEFQKQLKQKKDKDKSGKKAAKDNLNSFNFSPVPDSSGKQKVRRQSKDLEAGMLLEEEKAKGSDAPERGLVRRTSSYGEFQELKKEKTNKEKKTKSKKAKPGKLKEWKPEAGEGTNPKKPAVEVGKSRKTVNLGFSFGLITDEDDIPSMETINSAAAEIIPEILKGSMKECNIRCDSKTPVAEGDIEEDAWFESEDSVRWKITGTVPVKLFVEKGKEVEETAAPIQKMLKRYSSWRLVTEGGNSKWKRVREGRLALGITF